LQQKLCSAKAPYLNLKERTSVKQIRKRITYANVMSSIAVFLVLGGASAYAAKKIGSNEIKGNSITTGKIKKEAVSASKIKKNSVTTSKIANGAVTGAKLNLGSVGTVPNAAHANAADTANTANTANAVNGVFAQKINYGVNSVSGPQQIFNRAGLILTARCEGANNIEITATTAKGGSSIYTSVVDTDSDNNNLNDDLESGTFDPGDSFDLLAGNDGNPGLITFEFDSNDGTTVTGNLSVDEDNVVGTGCQAHGVLLGA
jgi:hypothetical protein